SRIVYLQYQGYYLQRTKNLKDTHVSGSVIFLTISREKRDRSGHMVLKMIDMSDAGAIIPQLVLTDEVAVKQRK
ncbi:MAG: hypothetical protein LWW75_10785, partial [Chlorobiales bacterium]|nr:hypothetical protein [Chlorobiales bacterium]